MHYLSIYILLIPTNKGRPTIRTPHWSSFISITTIIANKMIIIICMSFMSFNNHITPIIDIYMVRRVGFEPTMFALRDWFYRPVRHRHRRCRRIYTLERLKGIEPSSGAWKALILPLNYSRIFIYGEQCWN